MARVHKGTQPDGPDEGHYDPREGAKGYAPIVASFGALAVTAIVVVFSTSNPQTNSELVTLTTGLLAISVFASFLGAFGLAAVGAEKDPTANLPATVMFMAVPVALAFLGILGAFEVLAATFVPQSTLMFTFITGAGGAVAVTFSAYVVGDSWGMHPTTIDVAAEFDQWSDKHLINSSADANYHANLLVCIGCIPVVIALVLKVVGVRLPFGVVGVNVAIGAGIVLALAGTMAGLRRARHPSLGNEQLSIRRWEAWTATMSVSAYTAALLLILPT